MGPTMSAGDCRKRSLLVRLYRIRTLNAAEEFREGDTKTDGDLLDVH